MPREVVHPCIKLRNGRINLIEERLLTEWSFSGRTKREDSKRQMDCMHSHTHKPLAFWLSVADILAFSSPAFSVASVCDPVGIILTVFLRTN